MQIIFGMKTEEVIPDISPLHAKIAKDIGARRPQRLKEMPKHLAAERFEDSHLAIFADNELFINKTVLREAFLNNIF